jgi:hypothetical protein
MLYIAESAQFYFVFLQATISLTLPCARKHDVLLHAFAEDAQPKRFGYDDNARFLSAFSATALSYCILFALAKTRSDWKIWISGWIQNGFFKNVGTMFVIYYWLNDAKKLKTDYENLVQVYL